MGASVRYFCRALLQRKAEGARGETVRESPEAKLQERRRRRNSKRVAGGETARGVPEAKPQQRRRRCIEVFLLGLKKSRLRCRPATRW